MTRDEELTKLLKEKGHEVDSIRVVKAGRRLFAYADGRGLGRTDYLKAESEDEKLQALARSCIYTLEERALSRAKRLAEAARIEAEANTRRAMLLEKLNAAGFKHLPRYLTVRDASGVELLSLCVERCTVDSGGNLHLGLFADTDIMLSDFIHLDGATIRFERAQDLT